MQRVVILGRGGSGKSTLAEELGALTDLPVVHLDDIFWNSNLEPMSSEAWAAAQDEFVQRRTWIAEGDLGPYDVLGVRLRAADTVVLLDFSLARCAWRAIRRSRKRADFWHWLWSYRRRWRPRILGAVRAVAPRAEVRILRTPRAVRGFLAGVRRDRDGARGRYRRPAGPDRAGGRGSGRRGRRSRPNSDADNRHQANQGARCASSSRNSGGGVERLVQGVGGRPVRRRSRPAPPAA